MTQTNGKIFLVLDIGTSDIKCAGVDATHHVLTASRRKFPMVRKGDCFEIDFNTFLKETEQLLKECVVEITGKGYEIKALLITSQAQTFAPVDADFRPLRQGIVWLDERAKEEADFLHEKLPDFARSSGFARPSPAQYVSKLLWLRRHEPDIFTEAQAFPLINEFLAYHLTGKFYSDSTGAGMSGIYDFRSNSLNMDATKLLDLQKKNFPKISDAASSGEYISRQIQKAWEINDFFKVYLCGNDQGASACGAGLQTPGDISINFGSAMVFYTLTPSLVTELTINQIAGKHPVGRLYFLLNYEADFGIQMLKLKGQFFSSGTYDQLFETYFNHPGTEARLPETAMTDSKTFNGPEAHAYCAGVIKHYLNRLESHLAEIRKSVEINNIFVSGGMTRSEVFLRILREAHGLSFNLSRTTDAGIIGAVKIFKQNSNQNM